MNQRQKYIPWSDGEEQALLDGVLRLGLGNWANILKESSSAFLPNRDRHSLSNKWRKLAKDNRTCLLSPKTSQKKLQPTEKEVTPPPPGYRLAAWSEAEVQALIDGVQKYGIPSWSKILEENEDVFLPSRSSDALRKKWKFMNPAAEKKKPSKETKGYWTPDEVTALIVGVEQFGENNWCEIIMHPNLCERGPRDAQLKWCLLRLEFPENTPSEILALDLKLKKTCKRPRAAGGQPRNIQHRKFDSFEEPEVGLNKPTANALAAYHAFYPLLQLGSERFHALTFN